MTLPKNVAEADEAMVIAGGAVVYQYYPVIRAHLLSQDAEIERLNTECKQHLRQAMENGRAANKAESRLSAADALLRDIKDWDVNAAQGTCLMVPHSLRSRIATLLSENTHVQP